ncbi:MAG: H-NS histone family protein [Rubrivivax sp.]|jgi:DNA-binding protein H-NS|nr:H-NS histone family protein [Rubrivivax sp.]
MSTVAELMAQKAEIEKKIADAQREERASAIAQVRSLMAQHGLTVADLASRSASAPRAATGKAVSKVAAKYRDAVTGNTWSGRGLKPNWLKAALDGGKTLADFAV